MDTQDGILGTNMYAYCQNDPVNLWDPSGFASTYDLGKGWYAVKEMHDSINDQYHWHIWKGTISNRSNPTLSYALNMDGSIHDVKSWSDKGGPPNRVLNSLKNQTNFGWKMAMKSFFDDHWDDHKGPTGTLAKNLDYYKSIDVVAKKFQSFVENYSYVQSQAYYGNQQLGQAVAIVIYEGFVAVKNKLTEFGRSVKNSDFPNTGDPLMKPPFRKYGS
jgi:hypothetical protein